MVNRTRTSCYFSWKRCWLVFSYHGELNCFQGSKYIKYTSAYKGCISLCILYCLITCNIKSLFNVNVPKISHISRKTSQVSLFPAKSPDSRNKFVFLPKQPLLELSPLVWSSNSCCKRFVINFKYQGQMQDFWMVGWWYQSAIKLYVINFKLLHFCPKACRFRKDDGWLASQGYCFPRISICFPKYFIFWRLF